MRLKKTKKLTGILIAIGILFVGGVVFGLNGFFGGGAAIPSDTMTRGLVGYWPMDEGVGTTTADISGNNNTGSLVSMATTSAWAKGKVGGALFFDGTNDYVNVGNVGNVQSVEFWINDSNATDGILELINNSTYISIAASAIAATGFTSPTTYVNGVATSTLASGWNHVVITTGTAVAAASFLIGEANTDYTSGIIDEVRIYNRALSAAEIRYHYNRGGPVGYWKMDEGNGTTTYDSTDNNNDGVLYGGMGTSTAETSGWKSGKYGTALAFDGVNDYVQIPHNAIFNFGPNGDFTWEFWINNNSANSVRLLWKGAQWGVQAPNSSGKFWVRIRQDGSNSAVYQSSMTLSYFTWYHLVAIRRGSLMELYINGVLDLNPSITLAGVGVNSNPDSSNAIVLASEAGTVNYWEGLIDDFRIYNYARTPDEIKLDYNAGFSALFGPQTDCDRDPGSCMTKGLIGYWGFEEGAGAIAYDSSNYANNATTSGTAPGWAKGKYGTALIFDGTDDKVATANRSIFEVQNAVTFELWANVDSSVPAQHQLGIGLGNHPTQTQRVELIVRRNAAGNKIAVFDSVGGSIRDSNSSATPGKWEHIVAVITTSQVAFYLNGIDIGTLTGITFPTWTAGAISAQIGDNANSIPFRGLLDDVRIYNRALSVQEIRYHYNRGGPVAQWKMDEGSGTTTYDSTDNNNDGVLYGGMGTSTAESSGWKSGKYGTALSFDGVDDYVAGTGAEQLKLAGLSGMTAEAWIKPNVLSGDQVIAIENGPFMFSIEGSKLGDSTLVIYTGTWTGLTGNTNLVVGSWYHIAMTYDSSNIVLYLNGVKDGSVAKTGNLSGAGNLYLGGYSTGAAVPSSSWFNGLIDDVRIYNYARTQEQILQDYNAGFSALFGPQTDCDRDPGSCMTKGLAGQWSMDEGVGTTARDASNFKNNGTLTSGPAWTKGKVGSALIFDGSDDLVVIAEGSDAAFDLTTVMTYEVWVKPLDGGDTYGRFISKTNASPYGTRTTMLGKEVDDETNVRWEHAGLSTTVLNSGTGAMTLGAWNHVVGTYDSSASPKRTIYVNGVLKASDSPTGTITSSVGGAIWLGTLFTTNQNFLGSLDEVRIYNRALSAAEIRYHYNRGGPVAQWKMDEGSGTTTYDSTDNNNDGVLYGGMGTSTAESSGWKSGKYGTALSFDGVDDYVNVPDTTGSVLDITSAITISAWVNLTDVTGDARQIVAKDTTGEGSGAPYHLNINQTTGLFKGRIGNGVTNQDITGTTNVANGKWHFVVFSYDANSLYIYVDGVLEKTSVKTITPTTNNTALMIGSWNNIWSKFLGLIDDVRIYNYARTQEQILQDYNQGKAIQFR